jgi:hypothetical protein
MERIVDMTKILESKYENHATRLSEFQERSDEILEVLGEAAESATAVKGALHNVPGFSGWWPHVICPAASLIMGSYGLPPSAARNLVLVTFGMSRVAAAKLIYTDYKGVRGAYWYIRLSCEQSQQLYSANMGFYVA